MTPLATPSGVEGGPIYAPGQLALTLAPGKPQPGRPRLAWKPWSVEERLAIEMNDAIGSYSTGRYVQEAQP